jgi:hypothetical protein
MDKIGTFWGENISEMNRERLLDVVRAMAEMIEELRKVSISPDEEINRKFYLK